MAHHERPKIDKEVEGIVGPTVMQEKNVCNHCWRDSLCWAGTKTVDTRASSISLGKPR